MAPRCSWLAGPGDKKKYARSYCEPPFDSPRQCSIPPYRRSAHTHNDSQPTTNGVMIQAKAACKDVNAAITVHAPATMYAAHISLYPRAMENPANWRPCANRGSNASQRTADPQQYTPKAALNQRPGPAIRIVDVPTAMSKSATNPRAIVHIAFTQGTCRSIEPEVLPVRMRRVVNGVMPSGLIQCQLRRR